MELHRKNLNFLTCFLSSLFPILISALKTNKKDEINGICVDCPHFQVSLTTPHDIKERMNANLKEREREKKVTANRNEFQQKCFR
jgi:hypothetical protein